MKQLFVLALLLALCVSISMQMKSGTNCGTVYDGISNGEFDLEVQTSTSTIAAHWFDFGEVVNYEWAIASAGMHSLLPKRGECGGFFVQPDVLQWTNVRQSTSAINNALALSVEKTYYVLVRATFSNGLQTVASSDGVTVVSPRTERSVSQVEAGPVLASRSVAATAAAVDPCLCVQNSKPPLSVGELLSQIYGPPVWSIDGPVTTLFTVGRPSDRARAGIYPRTPFTQQAQHDLEGIGLVGKTEQFADALLVYESESSHDDDDGYSSSEAPAWVIAPIAGGIFLCGLIVFLLLLFVRVLGYGLPEREKGGASKGGESFGAVTADDNEKKDYAGRKNIAAGGVSDRTDISFPDTQIRRLSITHNDDSASVDALEEATRSPRRKHPIMQSTSSSFRDYRNNM